MVCLSVKMNHPPVKFFHPYLSYFFILQETPGTACSEHPTTGKVMPTLFFILRFSGEVYESGCRYFGTEKPFMQTTVRSASSGFECTICAKPKLTVQRTAPFKTRAALLSSGAFILLAIRMRCDPSGETTQISFRSISEM